MKPIKRILFSIIACCLLVGQSASAQMPMEPTEQHKMLLEDVGTWDCAMKIWAMGPESEPMMAKATEVNEMVGQFWLLSEFKGDMGGQPFEGRATIGFDKTKNKFVGTWLDSMSPYLSHMEGTYDKTTKTLTMMSKGTGPDGKPSIGKNTTVTNADGTKVFTMFAQTPESGSEFVKVMEITYSKRK